MKDLFIINFDAPQELTQGTTYVFKDIPRAIMSRPFIFRIKDHQIDINLTVHAHKSSLFIPKNLPNAYEPLLTMYFTADPH